MPLPQGYLPREGDELLIRVTVRRDYDSDDGLVAVHVSSAPHRTLFADLEKIQSIFARKWSEGDKVTSREFDGPGTVLAVSEDWVWVMCDTGDDAGGRYTLLANDLEPYVEPEELAVETMTEAELLAGLDGLAPPPEHPATESVVVVGADGSEHQF